MRLAVLVLLALIVFLQLRASGFGRHLSDDREVEVVVVPSLPGQVGIPAAVTAKGPKTKGYLNGFRPVNESRVAIITFTTEQKSYLHMSLRNHQRYANKHGYDFIVDFDQHAERGLMWHKFEMVERLIDGGQHDWIWWMDFDTLITNMTMKLTDVIADAIKETPDPDAIDWIFTPDCWELNAGSFITRASPRAKPFINATIAYHEANATYEQQLSEQDCIRDVIRGGVFANHVKFVSQATINAFPKEIKCWDQEKRPWRKGMFAIHFAGAWAHLEGEDDATGLLMRQYIDDVVGDDDP
ncbi:hypothetical protein EJ06DRAFT_481612 [Trichodelitschia bisporula]|uniref:Glycosyltransferase family 34 protein n=1 Tax=Trichodelitschia bisporula TaxID=703511 RepID=A0A6G1HP16_9PEZI|nr:hypothetical protein EJ06DRAFT_481612 [Trichodelitschia bisporula]